MTFMHRSPLAFTAPEGSMVNERMVNMSKPKKLGLQKPYTPNNRADYRKRKRGCNPADRAKPGNEVRRRFC